MRCDDASADRLRMTCPRAVSGTSLFTACTKRTMAWSPSRRNAMLASGMSSSTRSTSLVTCTPPIATGISVAAARSQTCFQRRMGHSEHAGDADKVRLVLRDRLVERGRPGGNVIESAAVFVECADLRIT